MSETLGQGHQEETPPPEGYGCPYRKCYPHLFTVEEYPTCAHTAFPTMGALKTHIATYHNGSHVCHLCGTPLSDVRAASLHFYATRGHCNDGHPAPTIPGRREMDPLVAESWQHLWARIFGHTPYADQPMSPGFRAPE
ncbi:hypothetical protein BR93DRAFT_979262 [Coniochaeta sp. PMI_546]|nr:hypothetical protein BR93DRAFT_979262 [Coniochaeta sp. PMI_546]